MRRRTTFELFALRDWLGGGCKAPLPVKLIAEGRSDVTEDQHGVILSVLTHAHLRVRATRGREPVLSTTPSAGGKPKEESLNREDVLTIYRSARICVRRR